MVPVVQYIPAGLELSQLEPTMVMLAVEHEDGRFPCPVVGSGSGQPLYPATSVAPGGVNELGKEHEDAPTSTLPVTSMVPLLTAVIPPLLQTVVLTSRVPLLVMLIAPHEVLPA
jgi:hypothetical protein